MRSWKRRTRYLQKKLYLDHRSNMFKCEHASKWWKNRSKKYPKLFPYLPWGVKLWRKASFLSDKKEKAEYLKDFNYLGEIMDRANLYVEDCSYHPSEVVAIQGRSETNDIDITAKSLVDGNIRSCSYYHCGVVVLTKNQAYERKEFLEKHGMDPYLVKYHDTQRCRENIVAALYDWLWLDMTNDGAGRKANAVPLVTEDGKEWLKTNYSIDYEEIMLSVENKLKEPIDADARPS